MEEAFCKRTWTKVLDSDIEMLNLQGIIHFPQADMKLDFFRISSISLSQK